MVVVNELLQGPSLAVQTRSWMGRAGEDGRGSTRAERAKTGVAGAGRAASGWGRVGQVKTGVGGAAGQAKIGAPGPHTSTPRSPQSLAS
jgi:hypothetical protein